MRVEQIYTGCLAHGAYYIESAGEAAIIDPLREVEPYLKKAENDGAQIKYVLETHFHADFVSGHLDLARKTGAKIVYGPTAKPAFDAYIAQDGEALRLGNATIKVLHTPGHTMESACFLLLDEQGKEVALFSGDTLFLGDVGRPDLAQKAANMTKEELAGTLYDSLREKIIPLSDDIVVYPGHGAGSACGKNMSKATFGLLGEQKLHNYALRADMTRAEFVEEVLDGLGAPPVYFPQNAALNKSGYESIDAVKQRGAQALSARAFEAAAHETEALILDTREAQTFAKAFIPNAINIGLEGNFAPWVGALIPDVKQPILLIAEAGKEEEAVIRLARVGYDQCLGYLSGGIDAWTAAGFETDAIESVSAAELKRRMDAGQAEHLLDVRKLSEYEAEHIENAENGPLDFINETMVALDRFKTYYVYCAGGYRSMVFISILRARGYDRLIDVAGGFKALKDSGLFKITDYVCPSAAKA